MLHLIVFNPIHTTPELIRIIESLSQWREVYPGCYLVNAGMTAYGIRQRLLPCLRPGGALIVTTMYLHRCAGRLPRNAKRFIAEHIGPDPIPPQRVIPYSF